MNTTLTKSGLTATINSRGAELVSLKNGPAKEYIWEGNPEFWGKHSPVLFPIVGTLKNNSFTYNNQSYTLSRHGFARDMDFEIIQQTQSSVTFSLASSEETLKMYPFHFELQITYTLLDNGIEIAYKVSNKNETAMPFSIGAHPAFALPGNFSDYAIAMEKDETLQFHLLENDLISDQTDEIRLSDGQFPLDYRLFENDALIFKTLQSKSLTIMKNSKPVVKVNFTGFPNLGIWTKENAAFLCIEPWFGYSDSADSNGTIFEKEGIQILQPAANFHARFTIETY